MNHVLQNEKALLVEVAEGNRAAYATLYTHYYPRLYRFVLFFCQQKEDAEEIIQDCLLKIWERKETLATIRSFEDYVFRMAKNKVFDVAKKRQIGRKVIGLMATNITDQDEVVEKEVIFNQYHTIARRAVEQLSARKREIFLMSTEQGMSLDEIALATNLSRPMVKKHLYSSIHFIKSYLRHHAEWPMIMLFLSVCL